MSPVDSQYDSEVLRRLQAAAGTSAPPGVGTDEGDEPLDYDWRRPCLFTPDQKRRMDDLLRQVVKAASSAVRDLLRAKVRIELKQWSQHYRWELTELTTDDDGYGVTLLDANRDPFGMAILSASVATTWVGMLLGGSEVKMDGRELSELETDLLLDATGEIIDAFSDTLELFGAKRLACCEKVAKDELAFPGEDTDEYCRMVFRYRELSARDGGGAEADTGAEDSEPEHMFSIIVRAAEFGPVTGAVLPAGPPDPSPEMRDTMRRNVGRFPVTLRATIGRASLQVSDILSLETGDVIVLDRKADDAIHMTLQGKPLIVAFPATTEGYYSVQTSSGIIAEEDPDSGQIQPTTKES